MGNICIKNQSGKYEPSKDLSNEDGSVDENELNINKLPVELGRLMYRNLENEKSLHGNFNDALEIMSTEKDTPLLVVFAEWPGCSGSKKGGLIFADKSIMRAVNEDKLFNAVAFNTWDRYNDNYKAPFTKWGGKEKGSDWGHVKIIEPVKQSTIAGTGKIYGYEHLKQVKDIMCKSLAKMGKDVPEYLK